MRFSIENVFFHNKTACSISRYMLDTYMKGEEWILFMYKNYCLNKKVAVTCFFHIMDYGCPLESGKGVVKTSGL